MEYKGYVAKVDFDGDSDVFHGEIINLRDVITFKGKSVSQLRKAMRESVEDYLAFCEERNEEPEKPFSGRILVRIDPSLHREIYIRSRGEDKSLNSWIAEKLDAAVGAYGETTEAKKAG
ncbi:MAG: toxin-antitoxin system HicB family antitoxin [Anaerolineales bacterium]|nr:toxin-antitoxin system HicB family antitoxin [Anaerolineales bacterium]